MTKGLPTRITVDTHLRCLKVYPPEGAGPDLAALPTVGVKLSREQAVALARVLLAGAQEWDEMELVAFRGEKSESGDTYLLAVVPKHYGLEEGVDPKAFKHPVPKGIVKPEETEELDEILKDFPTVD